MVWTHGSDQLRRIITLEKYPWKCHWVGFKWNYLYHPVINGLGNAVITHVLSWKTKFSIMWGFCPGKLDLSFIFKSGNYDQWSFILRGNSLGINFLGVSYPESNYPGEQLPREAIILSPGQLPDGYNQDFQYLIVSIYFFKCQRLCKVLRLINCNHDFFLIFLTERHYYILWSCH